MTCQLGWSWPWGWELPLVMTVFLGRDITSISSFHHCVLTERPVQGESSLWEPLRTDFRSLSCTTAAHRGLPEPAVPTGLLQLPHTTLGCGGAAIGSTEELSQQRCGGGCG